MQSTASFIDERLEPSELPDLLVNGVLWIPSLEAQMLRELSHQR